MTSRSDGYSCAPIRALRSAGPALPWLTRARRHRFFVGSICSVCLLPAGFLPERMPAASLLAVELPPGSRLEDTDRDRRIVQQHARGARGRERLRDRRLHPAGHGWRRARPTSSSTCVPQGRARAHAGPDRGGDQRAASRPFPTCAPGSSTTAASAAVNSCVMGTDGAALDKRRAELDERRCARAAELRQRRLDRRARPAGGAHRARADLAGRARHLDRGHRRRRSASPPSATSTPTSPSSTPATARSRSASSSTRRPRRPAVLEPLQVPTAAGVPVPLSSVADVASGRARPRSSATTASAAS